MRMVPEWSSPVRLGGFAQDGRGVAAVEFALMLPLMLLLYVGVTELSQAVMASRKTTLVARAIADLVAQQPAGAALSQTVMSDVFAAGGVILAPFAPTSLAITVSSVELVPKSGTPGQFDAKTRWTVVQNSGAPRSCATLTQSANSLAPGSANFPAGLYQAGSVIVADVAYAYRSPFGGGTLAQLSGGSSTWVSRLTLFNMRHSAYERPRQQALVPAPSSGVAGLTTCPP